MQVNLLLLIAFNCLTQSIQSRSPDHLWDWWKRQNDKHYEGIEEKFRRNIWEESVEEVSQHNLRYELQLESYGKTINKFSDLLWEEFREQILLAEGDNSLKLPEQNRDLFESAKSPLPKSLEWTKKGFVSPVKDQGNCISSHALASCGAIEGQVKKKTGLKLVELSSQQIIDCMAPSSTGDSKGCGGGDPHSVYQYVSRHGIQSEQSYPFKAKNQKCQFDRDQVAANITERFLTLKTAENEVELQKMLANKGPILVGMHVLKDLRHYSEGVFTHAACRSSRLNHVALLVGYGTLNGFEYWTVKNSWGSNWGDQGYFKLGRNRANMCGIASMPSVPVV